MPGRSRTPLFVKRCVRAVAPQYGDDVGRAFAICVGQAQKQGYIKAGTMKPTAKGKRLSKKKGRDKESKEKTQGYEALLAAAKSARAAEESLTLGQLAAYGRMLLEQDEEGGDVADEEPQDGEEDGGEEDDIASQLKGRVTGTLRLAVEFDVGDAPAETQKGVLRLLRRYKANFQGGVGGTSYWKVEDMTVALDDGAVVIELELNLVDYPGKKVIGDVVMQVAAAVEELAASVALPKVKRMLGDVSSDTISVEPTQFGAME